MKKKIVVFIALAMLASAGSALAATKADSSNIKGFVPTVKVNTYYVLNTGKDAYSATSAHEQGDHEYWSSSAYGGLAFKTVAPGSTNGTNPPTAPSTSTDSTVPSNYTTM